MASSPTSTTRTRLARAIRTMTTTPMIPMVARYRAAQARVMRTAKANVGAEKAAQIFADNVHELRVLGMDGPGLLTAAEHLTRSRLRARGRRDLSLGGSDSRSSS